MGKPIEGMFYLKYADENWEQALASHNIPGFESIQDAIDEANAMQSLENYVVCDHRGFQVYPVTKVTREQVMKSLRRVTSDLHDSMIAVQMLQCWGQVAAFPENYTKEDFDVLKQGFRQLAQEGYL